MVVVKLNHDSKTLQSKFPRSLNVKREKDKVIEIKYESYEKYKTDIILSDTQLFVS